jgi:3-deoxy-D-manno-octulosonic acid kinase
MPEPALTRDRAPLSGERSDVEIPAGFDLLRPGNVPPGWKCDGGGDFWLALREDGRAILVHASVRDAFLRTGAQDPARLAASPCVAGWIEGGRTRHALVRVDGDAWVLKSYRRGGLLGLWNAERYWRPARFLDELRLAARAASSGVPTVEVLALIVERAGLGSVRAWLVTRYLASVRPLPAYLGHEAGGTMFRAAGAVVRRMHEAGIDHRDLNWNNLVGAWDGTAASVHVVDWDRARVREPGSWNPGSNLVRLWRSAAKGRRRAGAEDLGAPLRSFLRGYFAGRAGELRRNRAYFRRQALLIRLRSCLRRTPR